METDQLGRYLAELSAAVLSVDQDEMRMAIRVLREARKRRNNVWIVGNGGSAATASHFANDLTKMCRIKAFAIPDMTSTMTAYGNDNGWQHMFEHTMDVYFEEGDVVVAISCSGRSPNVLAASSQVENLIVMSGCDYTNPLVGKRPKAMLMAPHEDIRIQEDVHLAMCHAMAGALRQ